MPLPLILGAGALASAAYGAKKGYDGYQKHSEADEIVKNSQKRYETKKASFDEQEEETTKILATLGKKELEIGKRLSEFSTLADELLQKLSENRHNKLEISIPKHELEKIESYSYTAVGVLGTVTGAGTAGAATGFAVYGGVMALGAASTGTPIASLAGAAASKATMAAIGGGSLASGGMGIAGGTAILGASVAAPVLAIAGWAYNSHGEKSLKNAHKASDEVDQAVKKMNKAISQLEETEEYTRKIRRTLRAIYGQFNQYFDSLKDIDNFLQDIKGRNADVDAELAKFNDEILRVIENGYALASILVNMIMTPLFKPKEVDSQVIIDGDGVPEMEKDENGFMIVNDTELDAALSQAKKEASGIEVA